MKTKISINLAEKVRFENIEAGSSFLDEQNCSYIKLKYTIEEYNAICLGDGEPTEFNSQELVTPIKEILLKF